MKNRRKFLKASSLVLAGSGSLGYHATNAKSRRVSIDKNAKKGMLLHSVYFWVKDDVSEQKKKDFEQGLTDLVSNVKEVSKAEIGVPASTDDRGVVDLSFAFALIVWFKDIGDHNIYQEHAAHKKFIEDFSSLWEKVIVYDSDII